MIQPLESVKNIGIKEIHLLVKKIFENLLIIYFMIRFLIIKY